LVNIRLSWKYWYTSAKQQKPWLNRWNPLPASQRDVLGHFLLYLLKSRARGIMVRDFQTGLYLCTWGSWGTLWLWLTVCHGKSPFLIGKPSISMGHLYHGYVRIRGYHPSLRSSGTISPDTSSARWTAKWRSTGASATSEFGAAHVRTTRRMPMRWSLGGADGGWRCFYHFLQFFTIFYHV
jgi:hypothetical protein